MQQRKKVFYVKTDSDDVYGYLVREEKKLKDSFLYRNNQTMSNVDLKSGIIALKCVMVVLIEKGG